MNMQRPLFEMDTTDNMTKEAIEWLRVNLSDIHSLVCFSGGKDSIVTEALKKIAEGKCHICGRPVVEGRKKCKRHLEYDRTHQWDRKRKEKET